MGEAEGGMIEGNGEMFRNPGGPRAELRQAMAALAACIVTVPDEWRSDTRLAALRPPLPR